MTSARGELAVSGHDRGPEEDSMQPTFLRWFGLTALAVAVVALSACSQERAPINRIQAMALDKHFFVGPSLSDPADDPEFYMGKRVIDEPYGVGQGIFLYQSLGSISRVKWEIQENVLNARLTYDRIQDSDHYGARSTDNGQLVAQYNISSHFDIIRDYNTQTGEQLNVFVENTTDRPWYEREYFRVDWSKNLVTDAYDFDLLSLASLTGVKLDPLQYYVEDPASPDAPVFDTDHGYFDVTNKVFATPQMVDTPYGTFPYCWFYGQYPSLTCNPAEASIRLSFKKVVPDDYEPEDWDGNKAQAFGWITSDRYGYDRNYGIVDQNWHRFAAKYPIWQASHVQGTQCAVDAWRDANGNTQNYKVDGNGNFLSDTHTGLPIPDPAGQPFSTSCVGCDVHRDLDHDGTEDECQFSNSGTIPGSPRTGAPGLTGGVFHSGSRCDEFTNMCDIPLYERSTRTIPLYYGPTAPPDLFAATAHALNSWNIAVMRSAQLGKVVEANRSGLGDIGQSGWPTSEADLLADQKAHPNPQDREVRDILVLCHNPVAKGDDASCGPEGLKARLGDLRYHMVNVIQNPQNPSAWGIMDDFDDPLTGEKVQASINVWAYQTDLAAQNVEDLLRWINGEITNDQIANGKYMSQWLSGSNLSTKQYIPNVLTKDEIVARLNSIDRSSAKFNGLPATRLPARVAASLAAQNLAQALGPSQDSQLEATRTQLLGSNWEAQLLTPDMLQAAGFDPTQPFAGDPATLTAASPLRGLNPRLQQWTQKVMDKALKTKQMCLLQDEPEPDSLVGMARQAAQLFPAPPNPKDPNYPAQLYQRDQALHQWIREQFHMSVVAHEIGHSVGLAHNFTGSWDSLNYHPEYWQLRTRNGAEHYCGATVDKNGVATGPLDATTPHTNGTDCVGPRWVDPVTDQEASGLIWKWASSTVMDYPGDQTQDMNDIGAYDKAAMRFGYADLVDVEKNKTYSERNGATVSSTGLDFVQALDGFGGIFGASLGNPAWHYSTYADRYGVLGKCDKRSGWTGDPNDPLALQCSGPDLDFVARRDMKTVDKYDAAATVTRPDFVANFAVDPHGRVRHPYLFGSDDYVYGNIPNLKFDAGADSYEQMQFFTSTYENRYVFDNFRRNRVMFNTGGVVSRLEARYWQPAQWITKALGLGIELLTQPGFDPTNDPGYLMPMALASADGLAMFVRSMTRPAPGTYDVQQMTPGVTGGPPNPWGSAWQIGDMNSDAPPPSQVNIALGNGDGRLLHNDYDYTKGYWWAEYQTQVGSYYEKAFAPSYLTEAYNNFVSNVEDDYVDGRYKNISYATLYPNQIRRLFANLMVTQGSTQVDQKGTVAQIFTLAPYSMPGTESTKVPNPLTVAQYLPWYLYDSIANAEPQLQYPDGAVLLDPQVGWETQFPALIDLFWFGPTSLNMNLVDQLRIFSPGDVGTVSLPPDQQVRYRDPVTAIEYEAKNYGSEWVNPAIGFAVAKSAGARMIQHANYLASIAYQQTQPPDPVTGELTYAYNSNNDPIQNATPQAQNAAAMLKGFASNLDTVRQLTRFFGYGPLGH
jgi:hypothetical protein